MSQDRRKNSGVATCQDHAYEMHEVIGTHLVIDADSLVFVETPSRLPNSRQELPSTSMLSTSRSPNPVQAVIDEIEHRMKESIPYWEVD